MILEDVADETSVTRWQIVGGLFLAVLGLFAVMFLQDFWFGPKPYESRIADSAGLQRVDRLCSSIPVPDGVRLVNRKVGGNTFTYAVDLLYSTDVDFSTLKEFYATWFNNNGWRRPQDNSLIFLKEGQSVTIEDIGGTYGINCAEKH